jgi:hypothetical protein
VYPLDEITREETLAVLEEKRVKGEIPSLSGVRERVSEILAGKPADWWNQRDPIRKLERVILDSDITQETALGNIRLEVEAVVQDALAFARSSSQPPLELALSDTYAG